jgi:hypothetical protein
MQLRSIQWYRERRRPWSKVPDFLFSSSDVGIPGLV